MKYMLKCANDRCEKYGKLVTPGSYSMKYDRRRKRLYPQFQPSEMVCPCCGRGLIVEEVVDSIPEFGVGTFKSKTDEEKRKILKQRYNRGMKMGGNDEKEMRKRDAISKMIGYDK